MSDNAYLVWMIGTAVMTVTVLTVGTLIACGIVGPGRAAAGRPEGPDGPDGADGADGQEARRPGQAPRPSAETGPGRGPEDVRRAA